MGISLPADATGQVRITAHKPGFASMSMVWPAGRVPARFDLRLPEAQHLGGRVVDEAGQPVSGAAVSLTVPQRLTGPWVVLDEPPITSDADGRWRSDAAPKDAAYVHVDVSHPDYVSSWDNVTLATLRSETAVYKLLGVTTVRGQVLDEAGRAVPDAQVVLGGEGDLWPGSATEGRADAGGRFAFRRTNLGKRLIGLEAATAAPALLPIEVTRGMPPLEIRLANGAPLRIRIVDEAGVPIPGARGTVDEWPSSTDASASGPTTDRWAYPGWEWHTDAAGRFVWSNAPPQAAAWTFSKGGFMSRGRQTLKPASGEHVITLGPAFRASGNVTDAKSGAPVPEFFVTARFVQVNPVAGVTRTNFGEWAEYQRQRYSGGAFSLEYESPLLLGTRDMHDWQFRVDADGYEPVISRVVPDRERGLKLDFRLQPAPPPDIAAAAPDDARRVTAGIAIQPARARPGDLVTVYVRMRLTPGYHIYALENSGCSNLPTSLAVVPTRALTPTGPWRGPEPKFGGDGSRTLAGEVLFQRRFLVQSHAGAGTQRVQVAARFQVCNEAACWPPERIDLEAELEVLPFQP
ncbi:MAG: protein-disulfide reductase DsbD domain-containing protein [Limisphaerales bacterium]